MAIRVIKHGTKRVAECAYCGCVFEYELEDINTIQKKHNEYTQSVDCPDCRREVETSV